MRTKSANTATSNNLKFMKVTESAVSNVRVVNSQRGDLLFFTLMLNGVTIYNCRVATGRNGDFISFPQYKGSNGTYYNNVYACLSNEDTEAILAEVQRQIDEK